MINLKTICQVEHIMNRSLDNFIVNMLFAIATYSFLSKILPLSFLDNIRRR